MLTKVSTLLMIRNLSEFAIGWHGEYVRHKMPFTSIRSLAFVKSGRRSDNS